MSAEFDGFTAIEEIRPAVNGRWFGAVQTSLQREVTLKVTPIGGDPEAVARFERECATVASLGEHPGIAPALATGRSSIGDAFLVLPRYRRGSLADLIAQRRLPWSEAVALIAQVADALAHAHRFGVVHGNVSPDTIMVSDDGRPVVVNFGMSEVMVQPPYSPPEARQVPADVTFDVYGLGVTLQTLMDPGSSVPPSLQTTIAQAMAFQTVARFQSMDAFARVLAGQTQAAPPTPVAPPTQVASPAQAAPRTQAAPPNPSAPPTQRVSSAQPVQAAQPVQPAFAPPSTPHAAPQFGQNPGQGVQPALPPTLSSATPSGRSWLVLGLVAAGLVAFVAIGAVWLIARGGDGEIASDQSTSSTTEASTTTSLITTTTTTAPSTTSTTREIDRTVGTATYAQLQRGDCFDYPSTDLTTSVIRQPCDGGHDAEVYGIVEHPEAGGTYPGDRVLRAYAFEECETLFVDYVGGGQFDTELFGDGLLPNPDEWNSQDVFISPCVASRVDSVPLSSSIEDAFSDPDILLEEGDTMIVGRVPVGRCFDWDSAADTDDAESSGLAQTVTLVECFRDADAEIIGSAQLDNDGINDFDAEALGAELDEPCAELQRAGEQRRLVTIAPVEDEWLQGASYGVCAVAF